jgi:hypothetical protein
MPESVSPVIVAPGSRFRSATDEHGSALDELPKADRSEAFR